MSGSAREDRTESASPQRLQKARDEGRVPISREMAGAAGLAGVTLAILYQGQASAHALAARLALFLAHADRPGLAFDGALTQAAAAWAGAMAPFVLAAAVAGMLGTLLQTGFLLRTAALRPAWSHLDPRAGLRRLFGTASLTEAAKSIARLTIMGWAVWAAVHGALPVLTTMPFQPPFVLPGVIASTVMQVLLTILGVQSTVALADITLVRLRFARDMRMSRQDLRDDQREADGDPQIKARIRQLRLQRARRRMLAAVPKATVVITNPTHYAVALAYDRARSAAPRVVAKGVDSMAARIRETAEAHRVPLVANPPLARVLHQVELDAEIPAEQFQAVAEIIAYVWRLNRGARL